MQQQSIHLFVSSKNAYAAAVYLLVTTETSCQANLVLPKARLAPTKGMTIPRLELLGVLIGVRAFKFVETEMKWNIDDWLTSKRTLTTFIENRLKEIITFRYVNTTVNPAGITTRGTTVAELEDCTLWCIFQMEFCMTR